MFKRLILRVWRRIAQLSEALREGPTSAEVVEALELEEPPEDSKEAAKRAVERRAAEEEGAPNTEPL